MKGQVRSVEVTRTNDRGMGGGERRIQIAAAVKSTSLQWATLVQVDLTRANLTGCFAVRCLRMESEA
jgi:uncharacterized protein YjbI with pentapeptide repeats